MNPVVGPLAWMLGTWLSDPLGAGTYPTLQPFQYLEEVRISHTDQPMLNFSPLHRQCGFIRLKPNTNKVAFVSTQNTGVVEVQEGEVNGQELCIMSHSIARISFTKEPHVEQSDGSKWSLVHIRIQPLVEGSHLLGSWVLLLVWVDTWPTAAVHLRSAFWPGWWWDLLCSHLSFQVSFLSMALVLAPCFLCS
uniref:THAP4-like heme-binding domain-containing protein n=1 Tax=Sciurus vulgaris TaxID=55149 RepID=A0A8D2DBC1_SCIVU